MLQYLLNLETEEDRELFTKLYQAYENRMYLKAYMILNNAADAEDIVHENFLALINNLEKIKGNSCHKTWNYLVTIVTNKAINLYNRKKKQPLLDENWENQEVFAEDLEEKIMEAEKSEYLMQLLAELKEPYKSVLTLQYYHELSYEEIAVLLEKSTDNIRHISMRGRNMLRKTLLERGIFDE